MLNQVGLVGRVVDMTEDGYIMMVVARTYKNEDGEYLKDVIPIKLEGFIKDNTFEHCRKGDVIGVKGCIMTSSDEGFDLMVKAEKVTLLSNKKEEEEEN